jgi:RNA polymerase sigma factor (sigma-70 family)
MKPTSVEYREGGQDRSLFGCLPRHVPHSSEQQLRLFRRLRQPGTSAREREVLRSRIVSGTLQIVLQCVRRVGARPLLAELIQEGVLALARSVDLFIEHDRTDFSRFAAPRVAKWLRRIKRSWARDRVLLVDQSIDELVDTDLNDPFLAASQAEREEKLEQLIEQLPYAQQRVLRMRYGIGTREAQSREAVSRELRIEHQRVRYLEECGLLALRRTAERRRQLGTIRRGERIGQLHVE